MTLNVRKAFGIAAAGVVMATGFTGLSGTAHADDPVKPKAGTVRPNADVYGVYVWASNVNIRWNPGDACDDYPSVANCARIVRKVSRQEIAVYCQKRGQLVREGGYSSEWWSYADNPHAPAGYLSNVYIRGKAKLDGVPVCPW
ncbi:hypothetical protein BZB76_1620 [Actinomadura pelletieri DSM 43383]|uniref:Peptidase inhibitor family I36 n=1 Tax=Actinomadura pelletieri DSM 43383 TaxID=1120940 RepID=A0A495QRZ7_9ACTN|nr:hypothetical protein [Actinomadura pelletieri]RKS76269.1 hypothetical protein BZB76_1620 [Actinomadura pelletieri DSM 43383]